MIYHHTNDSFIKNGYSEFVSFMANSHYDINGILTSRLISAASVEEYGHWNMTRVEYKKLATIWWDQKVFYKEAQKHRKMRIDYAPYCVY